MDLVVGQALREFRDVQKQGYLAAAVPYLDVRTNVIGLCAAGIPMDPDGKITELARSADREDRAAAAIMACTNVARATERDDKFRLCVHMTSPRRPMRLFLPHPSEEDYARIAVLAHDVKHALMFLRHSPPDSS